MRTKQLLISMFFAVMMFMNIGTVRADGTEIIQICVGESHSIILKSDGSVWTWGRGLEGQLGNGKYESSSVPVMVSGLNNIKYIAAGAYHNLAVDENGEVWAWGDNKCGQLGIGNHANQCIPVKVDYSKFSVLDKDVKVSAGNEHSIIYNSNMVLAFGSNRYGQLGNTDYGEEKLRPGDVRGYAPKYNKKILFASANDNRCYIIETDGGINSKIMGWGRDVAYEPVLTHSETDCEYISLCTGIESAAALHNDGMIDYINEFNKVEKYYIENAAYIATGNFYLMVSDINGKVYLYGDEFYKNNEGYISYSDFHNEMDISDIKMMAAGSNFALFLNNKGEIYGLGDNSFGQLGNGTTQRTDKPVKAMTEEYAQNESILEVSAGYGHTLCVKENGSVWAWGDNTYGQLGDGTNTSSSLPVNVKGLEDIVEVSAGFGFSMALDKDGNVWTWGRNNYGQLGNGTNTNSFVPVKVEIPVSVKLISAGYDYAAAVADTYRAYTWGRNNSGQLGDKTYTDRNTPICIEQTNINKVSAGKDHCMMLKRDGAVYTWGSNEYGKLGSVRQYNNKPIQITVDAKDIAAGVNHSIVLKNDMNVYVCGYNQNGELCTDMEGNRTELTQVNGLESVQEIWAGNDTSFARTYNGIKFWGSNKSMIEGGTGQIIDLNWGEFYKMSAGDGYQMYIKKDKTIWGYGKNYKGEIGNGKKGNVSYPEIVNWDIKTGEHPKEGNGTENSPFLIYSIEEFNMIKNYPESVYRLMNDIDFNNIDTKPVCGENNPFKGVFYGDGHAILNLRISSPESTNVGLFGVTEDGIIENLCIYNVSIEGGANTGAFAGKMIRGALNKCCIGNKVNINELGEVKNKLVGSFSYTEMKDNETVAVNNVNMALKTVNLQKNEVKVLMIEFENQPYLKAGIYTLKYDSAKLYLSSLGLNSLGNDKFNFEKDEDIEIIQNIPGEIKFKINKEYKNWTGTAVSATFIGKEEGESELKFYTE